MNAIYECSIMHTRLSPKKHSFDYRVFMLSIDIDALPFLGRSVFGFAHNRFSLFSVDDADHVDVGNPGGIRGNLTAWLNEKGHAIPLDAAIQLITFPRVLGYGFNPVSFYYIKTATGEPMISVAEVVNTYREMKLYIIPPEDPDGLQRLRIAKDFYVSPFSDPGIQFDFTLGEPKESWRVNIDDYANGERTLLSAIRGERRNFTSSRLIWYGLKYPLLSFKIIALIHWHALLLWVKKVPFFRKSDQLDVQRDVMRPHTSFKNQLP